MDRPGSIGVKRLGGNFAFHCDDEFTPGDWMDKQNRVTYAAYKEDCKRRNVTPMTLEYLVKVD